MGDISTTVYLCTKTGISTLVRIFSNQNQKDDNSERLLNSKVNQYNLHLADAKNSYNFSFLKNKQASHWQFLNSAAGRRAILTITLTVFYRCVTKFSRLIVS